MNLELPNQSEESIEHLRNQKDMSSLLDANNVVNELQINAPVGHNMFNAISEISSRRSAAFGGRMSAYSGSADGSIPIPSSQDKIMEMPEESSSSVAMSKTSSQNMFNLSKPTLLKSATNLPEILEAQKCAKETDKQVDAMKD